MTCSGKTASHRAFTLPELAIALAVSALFLAAVAPVAIRQVELRLAQKAGREITQIQDAARLFYADRGRWPQGVADLQAAGYLNATWSGTSAWQTPYLTTSTPQLFFVSVSLPAGLEGTVSEIAVTTSTAPSQTGGYVTVTSAVPAPTRIRLAAAPAPPSGPGGSSSRPGVSPSPGAGAPVSNGPNFGNPGGSGPGSAVSGRDGGSSITGSGLGPTSGGPITPTPTPTSGPNFQIQCLDCDQENLLINPPPVTPTSPNTPVTPTSVTPTVNPEPQVRDAWIPNSEGVFSERPVVVDQNPTFVFVPDAAPPGTPGEDIGVCADCYLSADPVR